MPLEGVDSRLRGAVAYVDIPALVGASGPTAALLHTPRVGTPADEVQAFVRSLVAQGQIEDLPPDAPTRGGPAVGAVAATPSVVEKPTHTLVTVDGRQELRRLRFS